MDALLGLLPSAMITLPIGVMLVSLSVAAYAWSIRQHLAWQNVKFGHNQTEIDWQSFAILVLIIAVGLAARLWGLGEKSLTHPEAYIPGIVLPPGISEPPPRYGFYETFWWHFHGEPHPMGFYMAMWAWVKAFGTSLESLRLPIVLVGTVSIYFIYRLAADLYDRSVGYLAAALLALHGLHMYWSQISRMYVPGTALGLLATILLWRIATRPGPNLRLEGLYLGVLVVGTSVQLFFWLLMGLHIVWLVLNHRAAEGVVPRLAVILCAAIALSSPNMIQALYTAYDAVLPGPSAGFLLEFYSFGFAFETDQFSRPTRGLPLALSAILSVICIGLALRGLTLPQNNAAYIGSAAIAKSFKPLYVLAFGMFFVCLGLTALAWRETEKLMIVSLLPLLALSILPFARYFTPRLRSHGLDTAKQRPWIAALLSPIGLLAIISVPTIFLGSFYQTVLAPRAFMIFVPYLLILIAAGVATIRSRRYVYAPAIAALLVIFALSTAHFKTTPNSPRDYKGLAERLVPEIEPNDQVFVLHRNWWQTPIFYFLNHEQLVAENFDEAVAAKPDARIWFIVIEELNPELEMVKAVQATHRQTHDINVLGHRAILFEPWQTMQ